MKEDDEDEDETIPPNEDATTGRGLDHALWGGDRIKVDHPV